MFENVQFNINIWCGMLHIKTHLRHTDDPVEPVNPTSPVLPEPETDGRTQPEVEAPTQAPFRLHQIDETEEEAIEDLEVEWNQAEYNAEEEEWTYGNRVSESTYQPTFSAFE